MNIMFAEFDMAKAIVPAMIVGLFLGFLFIVWAMTRRYKRIAPNVIGVIYGKKRTTITDADGKSSEVGFKLVTGGGVFIWPIIEDYAEMSTEAFQIDISEENVPTRKNVGVHVAGVATCRISPVLEEQMNAVQNFLGKPVEEMKKMIGEILRGHLRSIVGGLEVEELLRERSKFNELVVKECSQELSRMGIRILTLVIQDVKDKEGYIDALGKQAVAGAKRDAQIATAEAERETTIKTSDAVRAAAEVKAQNDAKIKDAEKSRDIQVAQFKLEVAGKQAEADMAGEIAKTAQEQKLAVLVAERDGAAAQAQTKVQALEAARKEAELKATIIVQAEADANAMKIRATGKQNAERIEAETRKNVAILNAETAKSIAEGQKNAEIQAGEGASRKLLLIAEAQATANQKTLMAQAEGDKAKLLAGAEGNKAQMLAVADGERAKLLASAEGEKAKLLAVAEGIRASKLAEAEGMSKLAEALKQLSEQGKLIVVLDRLPNLVDKLGEAGGKILKEVCGPMGAGLSRIDHISITDLGGGNSAKGAIGNIAGIVPEVIANLAAGFKARGINIDQLLSLAKIDTAELQKMIMGDRSAPPKPGEKPVTEVVTTTTPAQA